MVHYNRPASESKLGACRKVRLVSSFSAAKKLGVTQRRIRQLAHDGTISGVKYVGKKLWWFNSADIEAYRSRRTV